MRARILLPFTLLLVFVVGAFLATAYRHEKKHESNLTESAQAVEQLFEQHMEEDSRMMLAALGAIIRNGEVKAAFLARDREALYRIVRPLFEDLQKGYGITHFYFTDADRVNFLRVHKPDRHGDVVGRITTLKAEETGKAAAGVELGPLGTLTLRAVIPWRDAGKLIGFVELGHEIGHVSEEMSHVLGVDLMILVYKSHLDREGWEAGRRMLGREGDWDRFPASVIFSRSMERMPRGVAGILETGKHTHQTALEMEEDGKHLYVTFLPLFDAAGSEVGDFIVIREVTALAAAFREPVTLTVIFSLLAGGIVFALFYWILGRVEGDVRGHAKRLSDEIVERKRAESVIRTVAEGVSGEVGDTFFHSLVKYLAETLEVEYAFVGEVLSEGDERRVRTIAVHAHGEEAENVEYDLAGTPCENVAGQQYRIYERGVREKFPDDELLVELGVESYAGIPLFDSAGRALGHIAVLGTGPLKHTETVESLLRVFAVRCAAEIERKRAEEALAESEERFRGAFEAAAHGVTVLSPDGGYLAVNPAFCKITGYSEAELLAGDFQSITHPEDMKRNMGYWQRILSGEIPSYQFEKRYIHKRGHEVWVQLSTSLVKDSTGRPIELVTHIQDITERKKAEKALCESEEKFRLLLESAGEGIYGIDPEGKCTFANTTCVDLLGYDSEGDLLGKNMHDLTHHTRPDGTPYPVEECRIFNVFRKGEGVHVAEELLWRKDGAGFPAEYRSYPVRNNGDVVGAVVSFSDITERKRTEAHLRRARKLEAIGTLAGGIAHDFNNILTGILGYCHISLERLPKGDETRNNLEQIEVAGKRARDLVQQMLAFSRQHGTPREPVELHRIVGEALPSVRASLSPAVEVRLGIEGKPGMIMADSEQMHQVLVNLLSNAVDAIGGGTGKIGIGLENVDVEKGGALSGPDLKPGRYVKLTVTDTGCGMDEATLEHIFDPFFTTKEVGKGTGLGLAAVHGIIGDHEGVIRVESKPGQGTAFDLFFPRVDVVNPALAWPRTPARKERILLVESGQREVQTTGRLLNRLGYEVDATTSAAAALSIFRAAPEKFDLVIADQEMPGTTGDRLARKLLEISPGVPVILCTGAGRALAADAARPLGIREIVPKPLDSLGFPKVVRRVLDEAREKGEKR